MKYSSILLKLSGEALAGDKGYGVDHSILQFIAEEIAQITNAGVRVGIVIGGGNIFRGLSGAADGVDRNTGDTVGMLATMINSFMVQNALVNAGVEATVFSAVQADRIAPLFTSQAAKKAMSEGAVAILSGGTGNPFFTTDTAAALRCAELDCDLLIKATKVDGIYTADPAKDPSAVKISELSYADALNQNLGIMDTAAFALCQENNIPILVMKLLEKGNLLKAISGESVGSTVTKG